MGFSFSRTSILPRSTTTPVQTPTPPVLPLLLVQPSTFALSVNEGTGATASAVILASTGNGVPIGTVSVGTLSGSGASRVSTQVNGNAITVTLTEGVLAAGVYAVNVPIVDATSSNSPQVATGTLTVVAASLPATVISASLEPLASTPGAGLLQARPWPMRPGDCTAATIAAGKPSVFVNGVEQSVYAEPLPGLHPDGSYRALWLPFYIDVPSTAALPAEVHLDRVRTTTDIAKPTTTPATFWKTKPAEVWGVDADPTLALVPTDPTYLCDCDITFQPLVPESSLSAAELARFTTLLEARANALRTNTVNRDQGANGSVDKFRSTYDTPRALLAHWCQTGEIQWYKDALSLAYRLLEYVFPAPGYTGYSGVPNVYAESRFTMSSNSEWAEQYSQRLWSYAACWTVSGYVPFYTRVNCAHQNANSSVRANQAGAIQVSGDLGYIVQFYGMRPNIFKATRHLAAYAIGANRKTTAPSGYGNRNMVFPTEFPYLIDAFEANAWNLPGDWRNGVTGITDDNNDGTRNNAPHAEDFPTFQLSLTNHMYLAYRRYVKDDARIPGLIKANVDALLLNTRALTTGDTGYPYAGWGAPYWMNRNGPASQGYGGAATCVYFAMDLAAIAYCAAMFPNDIVNGTTYQTWYDRAVDAAANGMSVQSYDWGLWNVGWKIFGENFGNAMSAPYYRLNGVPTGPSTIRSLTVPTAWPLV